MSFIETPRFPPELSYYASGGPEHLTQIVETASGYEKRNVMWSYPRGRYNIAQAMKDQVGKDTVIAFFRAAQGRAQGFRFKDWGDYTDGGTGILGSGYGTGLPTQQMQKQYVQGLTATRIIKKPIASALVVKRNGTTVSSGLYSLDATTGIITFTADASSNASAITAGATTSVTLAANPGTLTTGQKLFLYGFDATNDVPINGFAHTINSVSGSGPYTFILATNTTGKNILVGSGSGKKYPQASDTLTWTGEFDVPVRFDTDILQGYWDTGLYVWGTIPLVEIKL